MEYRKTVVLKDGRECILRSGTPADAQAALTALGNGDWLTLRSAEWITDDAVLSDDDSMYATGAPLADVLNAHTVLFVLTRRTLPSSSSITLSTRQL